MVVYRFNYKVVNQEFALTRKFVSIGSSAVTDNFIFIFSKTREIIIQLCGSADYYLYCIITNIKLINPHIFST